MPKKANMQSSAAKHRARSNESRPLRRDRSAQTQVRDDPKAVSTSWSNSDEFAIQLLLDPRVTALEFRTCLSFSGHEVPVEMFVADLDDGGRVAFDLIDDERALSGYRR
jgi:hypothetical protein